MVDRHRVFISYFHKDDQDYKDYLINMKYYDDDEAVYKSIFDDYSVRENDIDDAGMTSEQIRCEIRDNYIKDATVLILLCGKNTKYRKHIDWELHAAMYKNNVKDQLGILVINLPTISQHFRACDEEEKTIEADCGSWIELRTRQEYDKCYPYMPSRVIDSFVNGANISVVNWNRIENNPERLMVLIDKAFDRRNSNTYDDSAPLRRNNS